MQLSTIQTIAIYILPLIFAITLHEAAHAYMAHKCGDDTAKSYGRLSLNPLNHIDPLGTIILPMISIVLGAMSGGLGIIFGWAKPVPINFSRLNKPKQDLFWVALAGPLSNLAMALLWALALKSSMSLDGYFGRPLGLMSQAGIGINISLMLLNLIPILPLDGGRIVFSLLPRDMAIKYSRTEPYGMWIVLILIFIGGLSFIITPIYSVLVNLIYSLII